MGTKAELVTKLGGATAAIGGDTFVADAGEDTITIAEHGYSTGDGPFACTTTNTLPAGLGALQAAGVLTLVANVTDGDTCTIDEKVYTFQDTLTDSDGNIHIGASASDTLDNLIAAINASGGTPGTDYATSNTIHPTVSAAAGDGDTMDLTAKTAGAAGNAIATTETFTNAGNVFGAEVLEGGQDNAVFLVVVDEDTLQLALSEEDAVAETPTVIDIGDMGTGTHTLASNVGLFADRIEEEVNELLADGNRVTLRDVAISRFWDGLVKAV